MCKRVMFRKLMKWLGLGVRGTEQEDLEVRWRQALRKVSPRGPRGDASLSGWRRSGAGAGQSVCILAEGRQKQPAADLQHPAWIGFQVVCVWGGHRRVTGERVRVTFPLLPSRSLVSHPGLGSRWEAPGGTFMNS